MCDENKKYSEHTQILVAPSSDLWETAVLGPVREVSPGSVKEADCTGEVCLSGPHLYPCPLVGHVSQTGLVFEGSAHKWRPHQRACALQGNAWSLCGLSCIEGSGKAFSTQSPQW